MVKNIEIQQPLREDLSLDRVLHALSDPVRLEIVRKLARQGQIPCGSFDIPMPKSSLSHHFRVLRESGVTGSSPNGNEIINFLRIGDLEARFPGLIHSVIAALDKRPE